MKLLSDLPKNPKYCVLVEPLWSIFGGLIFFYVPLYMKEIGLNEVQMGIVTTVNMVFSFVLHFFGAPITNKLGRKNTTLIFDMIAWSIPMVIWAVAQNFYYFLAAAVINAFVRIVYVSWFCLLTEDTPPHLTAKPLALVNLLNIASGIFTPITGIFINKYGAISTMRIVYAAGAVSMTAMFLIRYSLVVETKAGLEIMRAHSDISFKDSFAKYINTVLNLIKRRSIQSMTGIYVLTTFTLSINFFQIIYLKEKLGFSASQISITPGISAVINVILFIVVIPKLSRYKSSTILIYSVALGLAGSLLFILIPAGSMVMLLLSTSMLAVSNFLVLTYRDSVFVESSGEHEKADAFSAIQTITVLGCMPAGYIGGLLYSINPIYPFLLISLLFGITLLLSVRLSRHTALPDF